MGFRDDKIQKLRDQGVQHWHQLNALSVQHYVDKNFLHKAKGEEWAFYQQYIDFDSVQLEDLIKMTTTQYNGDPDFLAIKSDGATMQEPAVVSKLNTVDHHCRAPCCYNDQRNGNYVDAMPHRNQYKQGRSQPPQRGF